MASCIYVAEYPGEPEWRCKEEATTASGLCIFHDPDLKKDVAVLRARFEARLGDEAEAPLRLDGAIFPDGPSFFHVRFERGVSFRSAQFHGQQTSFRSAQFRGQQTSFRSAQFHGQLADFGYAQFHGQRTDFRRAQFNGDQTDFFSAQFLAQWTDFGLVQFHAQESHFGRAQFHGQRTDFRGTQFHGRLTNFRSAQFQGEQTWFGVAQFHAQRTDFKGTQFQSQQTDFGLAQFDGAEIDFRWAHARGAHFREANLGGADLQDTDLSETDLRDTRGLRLDSTFIPGARFEVRAKDLWSRLRRKYAGPVFAYHLFFLLVFLLPYAAKAAMWVGVNRVEKEIVASAQKWNGRVQARLEQQPPQDTSVSRALSGAVAELGPIKPCLSTKCREPLRVWQVLIGADLKDWWYAATALLLVLYSICRALMVWLVAPMRDAEERSGYSPPLRGWKPPFEHAWLGWLRLPVGYSWLRWPHYFVQFILLLAVGSFLLHLWSWLTLPVVLPVQ